MLGKKRVLSLVAAAAIAVAGIGQASAHAGRAQNQCVAPSGVELNQFYGVTEQIVAPFCRQLGAGEDWRVTVIWFMNHTFQSAPAGFVPAGSTPLEDYVAKFVGVKYIVDPGTPHEKTYLFKNKRHLWTGAVGGFPAVNTLTMGTLQPLSVGPHVVETYWVFSAMHCDGLGDVLFANCLPAGETLFSRIPIEVTAGGS